MVTVLDFTAKNFFLPDWFWLGSDSNLVNLRFGFTCTVWPECTLVMTPLILTTKQEISVNEFHFNSSSVDFFQNELRWTFCLLYIDNVRTLIRSNLKYY